MQPVTTAPPTPTRWRGIAALNASSAIAQVGQHGIAFILFPLALEAQGLPAWQIGVISSAVWLGMLLGLLVAPGVVARLGHGATVGTGLAASCLALVLTPMLPWQAWAATAALCGVGLGLRWIGLETWLYSVVPDQARGRIVGFHEALLGGAAVAGPALIAVLGANGRSFVAAAFFSAAAAMPLWWAREVRLPKAGRPPRNGWSRIDVTAALRKYASLGPAIAGLGGVIEGALVGLYPVYAASRGFETTQTAWLLTVFGVGAMLLQFPLGWMVDACGLRRAALLVALTTLAGTLVAPQLPIDLAAHAALMFVLGGAITGFLTLGLIAATQHRDAAHLTGEVGRVSIAYTGLSVTGPLVAGALASIAGAGSLMPFIGATAAVLAVIVMVTARSRGGR